MTKDLEEFFIQLCGVSEQPLKRITESKLWQIVPTWDLRPSEIFHNDCSLKDMDQCKLFLSERCQFIKWLEEPELYSFGSMRQADTKYLNVINFWKKGASLTPPIFYFDGRHLGKIDGHHRTTIALLSRTPVIPFYALEDIQIDGIELASDKYFVSNWQA